MNGTTLIERQHRVVATGPLACRSCGATHTTLTKAGVCHRSCNYQKVRAYFSALRKAAKLAKLRGTHRGRTLVFHTVDGEFRGDWLLTDRERNSRKAARRQQAASRRANRS